MSASTDNADYGVNGATPCRWEPPSTAELTLCGEIASRIWRHGARLGFACGFWSVGAAPSGRDSGVWADSGRGCSPFMEDQALKVVGQVGQTDAGLRPWEADRPHAQSHVRLLLGKHVLHAGAHGGLAGVGTRNVPGHRPPGRLLAMNPRDPADAGQPGFVGLRAIRRVRPDARRQIVTGDEAPQHRAVVMGGVGHRGTPNEPVRPIDGDMVLVAEHRNGNCRQLPLRPVRGRSPARLDRPARVDILLCGFGRLVRPDFRRVGRQHGPGSSFEVVGGKGIVVLRGEGVGTRDPSGWPEVSQICGHERVCPRGSLRPGHSDRRSRAGRAGSEAYRTVAVGPDRDCIEMRLAGDC